MPSFSSSITKFVGPSVFGASLVLTAGYLFRFLPASTLNIPAEDVSALIPYLIAIITAPPTVLIVRQANKIFNWGHTNNRELFLVTIAAGLFTDAIVARNGEYIFGQTGSAIDGCGSATLCGYASLVLSELLL